MKLSRALISLGALALGTVMAGEPPSKARPPAPPRHEVEAAGQPSGTGGGALLHAPAKRGEAKPSASEMVSSARERSRLAPPRPGQVDFARFGKRAFRGLAGRSAPSVRLRSLGLAKPEAAPKEGLVTRKLARPTSVPALSAGLRSTMALSVPVTAGRATGLARLGGPASWSAKNVAGLNGTTMKRRP